ATIIPDEFSAGRVGHEAWWAPNREGEVEEEDREDEWLQRMEAAENCAKVSLAGPLAHMKYEPTLSGEHFADHKDLLNVATYLQITAGRTVDELLVPGKPLRQDNSASRLWERLQADTADLIELHWSSIERVAEALLIHGL